ncbi:hypothetical protein ACFQY7_27665 [Actinomadura luteofluorescens]|uniref:hypothetical protein n=1 Tax=Actinomadura luteofluorescens TaxID=46163 RepID=UPI0036432DD5
MDEFVRDLIQFTHACGSPHYRELAKLAPGVLAGHKKRIPVLRPLSLTAISNVLSRQRQGPQDWGWVATFVLTCLHYVEKTGIEPDFPGPATLQDWHARYQLMRDELARPASGAGRRPGGGAARPRTPSAPIPPRRPKPGSPSRSPPPAAATGAVSGPARKAVGGPEPARARTARRPRRGNRPTRSPTPRRRLTRTTRGTGSPACRPGRIAATTTCSAGTASTCWTRPNAVTPTRPAELGILLLCHDRPAEAHAWLTSAAAAGDEAAKVLVNAEPGQRRPMAAELAYEFTLPGYRQDRSRDDPGTPTGAETYYRAAARAGHPGATVRMGLIYEARGEAAAAQYTFAEATRRHHDAHAHFTHLNAPDVRRRPPEQTT